MLIPHKVKNKGKYISFHYLRGWKARKIRKVQEISPQIPICIFLNSYYIIKNSIDKVNAILDIKNWEKVENIDKDINPIYTLELYYDTTKQDTNDDIKEITIYSNGEYVSFFTTSPGGVKQNYKTNIDISELIDK